jgi:hypothetical protein
MSKNTIRCNIFGHKMENWTWAYTVDPRISVYSCERCNHKQWYYNGVPIDRVQYMTGRALLERARLAKRAERTP